MTISRAVALASTLLLGGLACGDDGSAHARARPRPRAAVEPASEPKPPPEPPALLLLPWDTKLYVAPESYAPALTLAPAPEQADASPDTDEPAAELATPSGRVIRVIGKADAAGHWWKLETGPLAETDINQAGPTIEGLDVYALTLYVPAGTGSDAAAAAVPAPTLVPLLGPATLDPPTQSGLPRPPGLGQEWRVTAGAKVFWPNGKLAGSVRELHAFVSEPKHTDGSARDCFEVRIGPPAKPVTSLCFEPSAITVATPAPPDSIANLLVDDDLELWGGLIGDDLGHAEIGDATLGVLGGSPNAGLFELLVELDDANGGPPIDELREATPDEQLEDQ